ncbi:HNH endonuclease [Vibrio parahaemolyticus]|uniref:HNH nuclease domain-containing protein n=2 Tax=Vibrio TaxID=662 RepID=A0A0Q2SKB9_VIBFU|nr:MULTISPECIES: HNH endonuclease domain-containing protein [Vibrio]EHH1226088.1 HNH endonuclease [Vibrio vulnificus]MEA3482931.1 HNH endonuclease domain-containing protein [Pseudomonadota bacterium]OOI08530.1 HNH endonuclease [Vibrio sp. SALL6]TLS75002.1 HNH endonuclease [Photobacterium damselae subsp. damselae]EGS6497340.1 HNH endonuclease [Vibrio parahaemolyticus]
MPKISFTNAEISLMKSATQLGHTEWSNKNLAAIKAKIKHQKKQQTLQLCCYCQRDINSEFNFVLDIEHIIPKSSRLRHMFTMKNLSVSCKRCNMSIKGAKTDFLSIPIASLPRRAFKSRYYRFIHPNLDFPFKHLVRTHLQQGPIRLIKYHRYSDKGEYTYSYFRLHEFEVESANLAQGRRKVRKVSAESLSKFAKLQQ